jgi:hypothetical protein
VISELVPIALGVVASPIAIVVVIALLMTRGAALSGAGFVVGWCAGLFAMVAAFAWLSHAVGFEGAAARPMLGVIEFAAAGLVAVVAVVQTFRGRGLATRSLRGLDNVRMPQATVLGLLGSVLGPKIILLTGIAGATLATQGSDGQVWMAAAFALIGSVGVALPVLAALVAPERVGASLARVRAWIAGHDRVVSVVSLLVVASVLALDAASNRSL